MDSKLKLCRISVLSYEGILKENYVCIRYDVTCEAPNT